MAKSSARPLIRLRGVRHNNLKNFDLDLPLKQLIVITGLSGSGKSSLAFDTLFAEGQRRYIETFSPYARQFFDRMDKPQVDSIEGIPPAIAIEQRNSVRTTRSTIGTMTEICDYMKLLWPHVAELHCRQCGQPVRKDSPQTIFEALGQRDGELLITFDVPLTQKLSLADSLALVAKQGYQRLLLQGQVVRVDEALGRASELQKRITSLTVLQDRIRPTAGNRPRFVEACEQAFHFGKGKLAIYPIEEGQPATGNPLRFSNWLHCAHCDIEYHEPSSALFSFNHPLGACPTCRGFGRVISIDYNLALPDRSKTLAQGVVKPWQSGQSAECQTDLLRMCRHFEIPTDVPFERLPKKWQNFVIEGEPDYGKDEEHQWPRAWYGIKGYFRWLESRAYKMHVRVLLSRYRAYTRCPDCQAQRLQPEALLYRWTRGPQGTDGDSEGRQGRRRSESLNLADFYALPIRDALELSNEICSSFSSKKSDPLRLAAEEVRCRLGYLDEVGLGYLTLDRPTRSLSGGETERVNLTTCLGTRLVNALFVLDEPSVGLHPRDTERLVSILQRLRDAGNTVIVVEHEASVMRAADQIVDLGPGHGSTGGEVVFQGTFSDLLACDRSLTGQYLSGRKRVEPSKLRPVERRPNMAVARERYGSRPTPDEMVLGEARLPYRERPRETARLKLAHATRHNLQDLTVEIPLGRFVCVTGVSGSGKTTLVREVLLPLLAAKLKSASVQIKASDRIAQEENGDRDDDAAENGGSQSAFLEGAQHLGKVVLVDQATLGKTPRSNPAVYIGAFDSLRDLFAQSEVARQRGLNASAFSFNSSQGQCQRCRGAGFEKIEMQFLSDVFIRCPDCNGRRYRDHILEVKIAPPEPGAVQPRHEPSESSSSSFSSSSSKSGQNDRGRGGEEGGPKATQGINPRNLVWWKPLSIADLLDSTVEEALRFVAAFPDSRAAQHAAAALQYLADVGLGYLKLGQPINTLSGGESQRLKLVRHLADSGLETGTASASFESWPPNETSAATRSGPAASRLFPSSPAPVAPTLFLFDEPTTGLHFDDVGILLRVFQRLVDQGHSVLVIEHNLDVIKCADWIIDLGPEAGDMGGQLVAEGTPAEIAACERSHTGRALREVLPNAATPRDGMQTFNRRAEHVR